MIIEGDFDHPNCTIALHEQYGGACYWCCDTCNYDRHICHFCGDSLRHDSTDHSTGEYHGCYAKCTGCGHIGHEHSQTKCYEPGCECTRFRTSP